MGNFQAAPTLQGNLANCPEKAGEKLRRLRIAAGGLSVNVAEKKEQTLFRFDGFTLDLGRRGLYRGEERVRLTSKPLETLIFLIENQGRTVKKQELLDAVWKDTFVTEDNLVHAIREIRRALEDDREDPRFVLTVPRQGYRFVCEVSRGDEGLISVPEREQVSASGAVLTETSRKRARWVWLGVPALAITAILVWILWPSGQRSETAVSVGRINKQITVGEFASGKPAFSPDGKFILYVSSSEESRGYGDLFIRQFPEGTPLRITNGVNPSGDLPTFTSDGNHVVFSVPRLDQNGIRHHDLWRVPAFGGPAERFIEDASGAGFSTRKNWIAYTKHLPSGNALWLNPAGFQQEHIEVSATGYTPRWSPDGEWLAYTTSDPNGGDGDIWVCKVFQSNGGRPVVSAQRQVTSDNKQIYGLTWAADSRTVFFTSKRAGSAQLYQVSIVNGSVSPLLIGVGEYDAPSASPDGKTLVFQNKHVVNDLKLTTIDGNCIGRTITYGEFHRWPRISPSGTKLVSVLRQVDNSERLYLTDVDTRESSRLSERPARHPCWLDEEDVAFLSPDASSQNTEVLVVSSKTRETRVLTVFPGQVNWLAIHPGDQRLAVVMRLPEGKERLVLRDLASPGDLTIHEASEYEELRWSPDGSALCWNRPGLSRNAPHQSGGIWMIEIGKTEPRFVANDGYCPVWSADSRDIYFTIRGGRQGLWRYDQRQKKEHLVCRWGVVFSFDLLGDRVVFAQHKNDSQVYSMSLDQ